MVVDGVVVERGGRLQLRCRPSPQNPETWEVPVDEFFEEAVGCHVSLRVRVGRPHATRPAPLDQFLPCALLVVDVQLVHAHPDYCVSCLDGTEEQRRYFYARVRDFVVPNASALVGAFRAGGLPVVHVGYSYSAPDGSDLPPGEFARQSAKNPWSIRHVDDEASRFLPGLQPRPDLGDVVLHKVTTSTFASTRLEHVLANKGVRRLFMTGLQTDCCVQNTAFDAVQRGYEVVCVEDACATMSEERHAAGLAAPGYHHVTTTGELLKHLEAWNSGGK